MVFLQLLCGDAAAAANLASRAASVCTDNDIPFFFSPTADSSRGATLAQQGDVVDGLAQLLQSLAEQRAVSGSFFCDVILAYVAIACGQAGRWDEGLRHVEEGTELTETKLERLYAAELWRVKGELLLGKGRNGAGQKKIRGQRDGGCGPAVLWPRVCYRPETGGRIPCAQERDEPGPTVHEGRQAHKARELLRSLYTSFTEGFDTKDLIEAKALLESRETDPEGTHCNARAARVGAEPARQPSTMSLPSSTQSPAC